MFLSYTHTFSQEKQKYDENDLEHAPLKIARSIKKLLSRRTVKDSSLLLDEPEIITRKMPIPRKAEIVISEMMPETQIDEDEEAAAKEPLLPPPAEVVVEIPVKEISKRKRKRKRRRKQKRPRRVVFKLPRPCKVGVCKPDICYRRILPRKLRTRYVHGFSFSIA